MTIEDAQRVAHNDGHPLGVLTVCGINHESATLAEREPFQINRHELVPALKEMCDIRGVNECMILSTCNRFEAYLVLHEEEEPFTILREFFILFRGKDPKEARKHFYVRHGTTAARHLFRVTSGLDSMVLGEYQIQNQVREAYSAACSVKAPGKLLHRLVHQAFRAGKAIRTQTQVGAGRMSVAGMAVGVIKERMEAKEPVLMVGANENIRIVAEGLKAAGFKRFVFANRTAYKADKLATRYGGEGHGLDDLPGLMAGAACVVSCTGATGFIIDSAMLETLVKKGSHPRLCVDIAVPRDIETSAEAAATGFPIDIVDLEDLNASRTWSPPSRAGWRAPSIREWAPWSRSSTASER
ncbi:MAG: glutamyl-tRNA reductase [Planctomycetota bacterium]|jgi:glutamyl-tRNA reductase